MDVFLKKISEEKRRIKERPTIFWLSKILKVGASELIEILDIIRQDSFSIYRMWSIKKKNNEGERQIHAPIEPLKRIQKKIHKRLLKRISKNPNAFGFSGGKWGLISGTVMALLFGGDVFAGNTARESVSKSACL